MTIDTVEEQLPDTFDASGDIRFVNPETNASYIADVLSERYNKDWLKWEPETLWQTLKQDFHTDIHPVNREKLNAAKTLLMVDDFWIEWQIFEKVVKAFNNQIPSFLMLEGCTPGEMSWCVEESYKIRINKFSDEVSLYVRANCLNAGYVVFPPQLSFAQGNIDGLGREILAQWNDHNEGSELIIKEDAVGVQLARLNTVNKYIDLMEEKGNNIKTKHGDIDVS